MFGLKSTAGVAGRVEPRLDVHRDRNLERGARFVPQAYADICSLPGRTLVWAGDDDVVAGELERNGCQPRWIDGEAETHRVHKHERRAVAPPPETFCGSTVWSFGATAHSPHAASIATSAATTSTAAPSSRCSRKPPSAVKVVGCPHRNARWVYTLHRAITGRPRDRLIFRAILEQSVARWNEATQLRREIAEIERDAHPCASLYFQFDQP